ncbi:MAG TPA: FtsX-like permease family protein, partial [Bryobacteraceae bacterium]|nr:FtsX-like permease family protein [Bryobacteraceae bacterium]
EDRGRRFLTVAGRLARGAKVGQARAEIEGMAARLEREYPETNRGRKATVETEMESRMGGNPPVGPFAWLLAAMGAVILAIAAANAGGLLLGRAERKSQEIAVKLALGATWMRLAAGFAREAMGVVAAGAALGFPMAWAAAKMLARRVTLPTDFSFSIDPKFDARIGAVAALGLGVIAITCACAPAMAARRIEIGIAIQRRSRWRGALAAVEIGLAGALAMMGVALVDGIRAAQNIDPGYRVEQVVTVAMDPVQEGYTKAQARAFFETVLERVRGVAGVKRAALAQSAVLGYMRAPARVQCERDAAVHSADDSMWMNTVSPEYFELMRLPLMAGRGFDERDTEASEAAAIVNQELAKRCGMGQRIRVNGRAARVVGIARNAKYFDLQEKTQPYVYLAFAQNFASRMVLHAEVEGDAARMIPALERVIHAIDPGMAVSEARPLGESIERGSMFSARAAVDAVSGIGGCAIALALVGVYGAIAQFTARRKREMGIRAALGASTAGLIRWAMRGAGELVAIGVAGGMAAGVAGERLLAARVPGIPGWDWAGLWAVAGILAIAAVAGLIPAGRAARSNPTVLLRTE